MLTSTGPPPPDPPASASASASVSLVRGLYVSPTAASSKKNMHKRDAYGTYFEFDDGASSNSFYIPQAWRMSLFFVILAAVVLTYTARTNVTSITRFVNICEFSAKLQQQRMVMHNC